MANLPKKQKTIKTFDGNQKVSPDGNSIRMSDGSVFRRTVLPSTLNPLPADGSEDLEEPEFGNTEEQ